MPQVKEGEGRDEYMQRCMVYPDLQHHPEHVRAAICEHLFDRESKEEATPGEGTKDEQAPAVLGDHFEQLAMEKPQRIDRDAGVLYGVRILGIKSAHGYTYDLEAQKVAAPRFEQMCMGLDHDYASKPMTIPDAWGVISNPRVDDKGTLADVTYLKTHMYTEQILEDAERNIGIFSVSPVTQHTSFDNKTKAVKSFVPVRCDMVVRSATNKKIFEQAAAADAKDTQLALQAAAIEELKTKVSAFEQRLALHDTHVKPEAKLEQTIADTTKGIDLKAFWNIPT